MVFAASVEYMALGQCPVREHFRGYYSWSIAFHQLLGNSGWWLQNNNGNVVVRNCSAAMATIAMLCGCSTAMGTILVGCGCSAAMETIAEGRGCPAAIGTIVVARQMTIVAVGGFQGQNAQLLWLADVDHSWKQLETIMTLTLVVEQQWKQLWWFVVVEQQCKRLLWFVELDWKHSWQTLCVLRLSN